MFKLLSTIFHKCTKNTCQIIGDVEVIKTWATNFDLTAIPTKEYIDTYQCQVCQKIFKRNRKYSSEF